MSDKKTRLLRVWMGLLGLTMAMAIAADVGHASRLGNVGIAAIGVVTIVKVRLILGEYLALQRNAVALNALTTAAALTIAVIVGSFILIQP